VTTPNDLASILKYASREVRQLNADLLAAPGDEKAPVKRANKYNARKTMVDGHLFDSKKESERYLELKYMQEAGLISDLSLQPKFILQEAFTCSDDGKRIRAITYSADFSYVMDGCRYIEDVKGEATRKAEAFRLKWRLLQYMFRDCKGVRLRTV